MQIISVALVVIDTDGSAFITKAEFDSLKNNFQAQIDNYNSSLDSKIDGAIASYLSGIRLSTIETIENEFVKNNGNNITWEVIDIANISATSATNRTAKRYETRFDVPLFCIAWGYSSYKCIYTNKVHSSSGAGIGTYSTNSGNETYFQMAETSKSGSNDVLVAYSDLALTLSAIYQAFQPTGMSGGADHQDDYYYAGASDITKLWYVNDEGNDVQHPSSMARDGTRELFGIFGDWWWGGKCSMTLNRMNVLDYRLTHVVGIQYDGAAVDLSTNVMQHDTAEDAKYKNGNTAYTYGVGDFSYSSEFGLRPTSITYKDPYPYFEIKKWSDLYTPGQGNLAEYGKIGYGRYIGKVPAGNAKVTIKRISNYCKLVIYKEPAMTQEINTLTNGIAFKVDGSSSTMTSYDLLDNNEHTIEFKLDTPTNIYVKCYPCTSSGALQTAKSTAKINMGNDIVITKEE